MILMIPVKKANIPVIPAINIGMDNARLLKNVAPPRCPEAITTMNETIKTVISHIDHCPK